MRNWAMGLVLGLAGSTGLSAQEVPPGTGLVAYWTLNDAGNPTAVETSGSPPQNDGTYSGTALPTTSALVPQAFGLAHPPGNTASRVFTQATSGQRVQVPDASDLSPTGSFSVTAWVRPAGAQTEHQGVVEKHSGGSGFFLRMSPTMVPRIAIANGSSTPELGAGAALTANAWSHLAATYDGGTQTLRLYVNGGAPAVATGIAPPAANTAALHIGNDYGVNRFAGNIDDVRLYSRPLSATEVTVLASGLATPVISSATPGPGMIDLAWGAVPNATSYRVFQGPTSTGPWTQVGTPTGTTFTDTTVLNPNPYFYQVVAVSVIVSNPSASFGPVVPQSLIPRTNDHEEGFVDDNCACGSTIPGGPAPWAVLGLLLAFRRRR